MAPAGRPDALSRAGELVSEFGEHPRSGSFISLVSVR
jgi:hypothetical protein